MKATITFNLDDADDRDSHAIFNRSIDLYRALGEIQGYIRNGVKRSEHPSVEWEHLSEFFHGVLHDVGISHLF